MWSLRATIAIVATCAVAAAASTDWQLASSNENIFDPNAPDGQDWTFTPAAVADSFFQGSDTIALNSGITYDQPSADEINSVNTGDDNQQLFLNDGNDLQTNDLLLADLSADSKGGECSSSNGPGKKRRRNTLCTTGFPFASSGSTISDPSALDRLYCPTASLFIKSLFVCSSPDPLKTILQAAFYTLLDSTRCK